MFAFALADVTNPAFKTEEYIWQFHDKSHDDFCPDCFDQPPALPPAY